MDNVETQPMATSEAALVASVHGSSGAFTAHERSSGLSKQTTEQGGLFEEEEEGLHFPPWPLHVRPGDVYPMAEQALQEGHPVVFEGFNTKARQPFSCDSSL